MSSRNRYACCTVHRKGHVKSGLAAPVNSNRQAYLTGESYSTDNTIGGSNYRGEVGWLIKLGGGERSVNSGVLISTRGGSDKDNLRSSTEEY